MADSPCAPQVQCCRMRIAALESDGRPMDGDNMYVSKSLVSIAATPVYRDGDEIEEPNACGEAEVNYKGPDSFKRIDVTVTLLTPDPYLMALMSGGDVLDLGSGRVGYAAPAIGLLPTEEGISLEGWAKRVINGSLATTWPYARHVFPKLQNLRLNDWSLDSGSQKPSFTGQAVENSMWFDGPANDWPGTSDRVYQWLPDNAIPAVSCGPLALVGS